MVEPAHYFGEGTIENFLTKVPELFKASPIDGILLSISALSLFWIVRHMIKHFIIYNNTNYIRTQTHVLEHLSVMFLSLTLQILGIIYHLHHFLTDNMELKVFMAQVDFLAIISGLFGVFNVWICKLQSSELRVEHKMITELYQIRRMNKSLNDTIDNKRTELTSCLREKADMAKPIPVPNQWTKIKSFVKHLKDYEK